MKRNLLTYAFLLVLPYVHSQNFDEILTRRQTSCPDISYNSALYFTRFMQEGKIDSAGMLLRYWETKCNYTEPVMRAGILLALSTGTFSDTLFHGKMLDYIFNYRNRIAVASPDYQTYEQYRAYFGYVPPGQEFDQFTREFTASLQSTYKPGTPEYLWSSIYASGYDSLFLQLQSGKYSGTALYSEYRQKLDALLKMPELHMSWITGIWIPTGALKKLGLHPELGFQMGAKSGKNNVDMVIAFKFVNTPDDYFARRTENSMPEKTHHFFGGHVGLDVGRDLVTYKNHEVQLTGGIAFDGFDVLKEDSSLELKSASTASYNFNLGLGYRHYFNRITYAGLRAKYNFVDYTLNDVIDLTGNVVTIQFIVGGLNNIKRNSTLDALRYSYRR